MQQAIEILGRYEPISLSGMESVKLMDRTDTKYTFHVSQLATVLSLMQPHYRTLEIEGKRMAAYRTLYYDTADLQLYTRHHNGKLNRYKVRHRTYVDSGLGYLEVKFKTNTGRTIKDRIREGEAPYRWNEEALLFLGKKTPYDPFALLPALWVNYSRITLVSRHSTERLTIDLGLEFIRGSERQHLGHLVIAEVKQEKAGSSIFAEAMKTLRIAEGSVSKYCMAVAYTCQGVKKNAFKEKLLSIQKLSNYTYADTADRR